MLGQEEASISEQRQMGLETQTSDHCCGIGVWRSPWLSRSFSAIVCDKCHSNNIPKLSSWMNCSFSEDTNIKHLLTRVFRSHWLLQQISHVVFLVMVVLSLHQVLPSGLPPSPVSASSWGGGGGRGRGGGAETPTHLKTSA